MKDFAFVVVLLAGLIFVGLGMKEFYEQGMAPRLGQQEKREFQAGPVLSPFFNAYDAVEETVNSWFAN